MSKTATIEQRFNERYEQVATEAKATLEKVNNAVRGAYTPPGRQR